MSKVRPSTLSTHLTCGVYDLGSEVLLLVADDLAERVLDCGIVALDEVAVDITNCEGGFACEGWSAGLDRKFD